VEPCVDPIELENDAFHRTIAERIRADPSIIEAARTRLERWIAKEEPAPLAVRLEWRSALRLMTPEQLAAFLESRTPRARRMRISSPFFGL
jgi:hypothetical protein